MCNTSDDLDSQRLTMIGVIAICGVEYTVGYFSEKINEYIREFTIPEGWTGNEIAPDEYSIEFKLFLTKETLGPLVYITALHDLFKYFLKIKTENDIWFGINPNNHNEYYPHSTTQSTITLNNILNCLKSMWSEYDTFLNVTIPKLKNLLKENHG